MNNGKICVSICAETADKFIESIKRAEKSADVIELRFDCLGEKELVPALREVLTNPAKKNLLVTFRPAEQGGKRQLHIWHRMKFWELFFARNKHRNLYVDFETDLKTAFNLKTTRSILSYHDFSGGEDKSKWFYEINTLAPNDHILKIAVQANEITDTIAVWKLLEKAKSEEKPIIPIAMGEAGKWTRILGLAYGAFMTYASLDTGSETAPGQISAKDLIEVYRVKELNEKTKVFGIIGGNTSYSMSPYIHNAAFRFQNLNSVFVPLQVKNLEEFMRRMVNPHTREINLNFRGFAVTIPHKIEIMKYLGLIDESAEKIGAVNTILMIEDDEPIYGFNTDAEGFIQPLRNIFGTLIGANAAVIGAGGAARAVCYALKKAKANVTVFARNLEKAEKLKTDFGVKIENLSPTKKYGDFDILVNTTPLGTKGELENQTPAMAEQLEGLSLVYDLVYNPPQTKLLSEADKSQIPKIGGLEMLVSQGAAQQKIWTGLDAPVEEIREAILQKLH